MYYASPYRLFGYVLPELICLVAAAIQFIYIKRASLPKEYLCFFFYMWLVPPIISVTVGLPGNYMASVIPLGLLLTSIDLAVLMPNVNSKLVIKYYRYLVYVAIAFFIIQEISGLLIGWRPTAYLSFLDSYYSGSDFNEFTLSRSEMDRSSSFFLEPSHFLQYILPYVCIVACQCSQLKKISIETAVLLLVVLWSKSGVGYFILLVICVYLFLISSKKSVIWKAAIIIIGFSSFIFITRHFADNTIVAEINRRITEFSFEVNEFGQQSGFFRIWRGYFIYDSMDFMNQLFGASLGSVEYIASKVIIPGVNYEGTYMNGVQSLLVTGGVVGTILFSLYIRRIYMKFSKSGRCVLVSMIGLFFIENMLYSPKMFLYILIAYCISQIDFSKNIKQ